MKVCISLSLTVLLVCRILCLIVWLLHQLLLALNVDSNFMFLHIILFELLLYLI